MVKPTSLVRSTDSVSIALKQMRENSVSSVYVIDQEMHFLGVVLINDAVEALQNKQPLSSIIRNDLERTNKDTPLSEVLPVAAQTRFPLAVIDEEQKLCGILSKASVLAQFS